jgi:hypothetical protein
MGLFDTYIEKLNPFKKKLSASVKYAAKSSVPGTKEWKQSNKQFLSSPITKTIQKPIQKYQSIPSNRIVKGLGNEVVRQFQPTIKASKQLDNPIDALNVRMTPVTHQLAADKLSGKIKQFADEPFRVKTSDNPLAKYNPLYQANKALVELAVNVPKNFIFGDPKTTRLATTGMEKAMKGETITPEEKAAIKVIAEGNMLNIAGMAEGVRGGKIPNVDVKNPYYKQLDVSNRQTAQQSSRKGNLEKAGKTQKELLTKTDDVQQTRQGLDQLDNDISSPKQAELEQRKQSKQQEILDEQRQLQETESQVTTTKKSKMAESQKVKQSLDSQVSDSFADSITPDKKIVKQEFKTKKFDLSKTNQQKIDKLRKTLGYETRTVRSFEDMRDIAEELGTSPEKLLKDIETGRITDAQVVALSDVISTSTERIGKLNKQLKKSPTDEVLQRAITREEAMLEQALRKYIKGGTEAGRAVVAYKIIANKTLEPTYWLAKAQKQLGEGKTLNAETIEAIRTMIQNKDRQALANFVSLLGESTIGEKAVAIWKAGLLTSVRTHLTNMLSNTTFGVMETLKDIPATAFDIGVSKFRGGQRSKSFGRKTLTGTGKGVKEGGQQAVDYLKTGIDPNDANKFDINRPIRFGNTKAGRAAQWYVDRVFRTLGAEDKVFRQAAFHRSLADQAMATAKNKKLTAGELDDLIANPTPEMLETATKEAGYTTFTNDNRVSSVISKAKSGLGGWGKLMDVILPFVKTPTNVVKAAIDYTPPKAAIDVVRKIAKGDVVSQREAANAFGRGVVGTSVIAAGYALAEADKIQTASPAGEADRSQMYLEGRQPNSMLLNGQWVSISKVSPVGNLLVIGAEIYKARETSKNWLEGATQATLASAKSLTEQSFLKGLSEGLGALNDPEAGVQQFVEGALGGLVPNIIKDVARGKDDIMRQPDTTLDKITVGIPGLREELPPRYDALGNAIPENNLLTTMLNPFNPKKATNDPVILEMKRVGYSLNYVGDTISNQKLTPEQQRAYQVLAGAKVRERLVPLMESEEYLSSDIDEQNSLIKKAVDKAKDDAREEIKPLLESIKPGSDRGGAKAAEYENEAAPEQSKLSRIIEAASTDPIRTADVLLSGEPIRKTDGGMVIAERQKGLSSYDMGNKGTQVDHKKALSLEGSNKRSNMMILTNEENQRKGRVETYLGNQVKNGTISKKEAQKRAENWREEYKKLQTDKKTEPVVTTNTKVTNEYAYTDKSGDKKTIDISDYVGSESKEGIDKYILEKDKKTTAYKIYKTEGSDADKRAAISKMGLKYEDIVYGYHAKQPTDVKYGYLIEMIEKTGKTKEGLAKIIEEGRKDSISGDKLITNGMLDDMEDAGLLTAAEVKKYKGTKTTSKKKTSKADTKKAKKKKLTPLRDAIKKPTKRKSRADDYMDMLTVNVSKLQAKPSGNLLSGI